MDLVIVNFDLYGNFHVWLQDLFHAQTQGAKLALYICIGKPPNNSSSYGSFLTTARIHEFEVMVASFRIDFCNLTFDPKRSKAQLARNEILNTLIEFS